MWTVRALCAGLMGSLLAGCAGSGQHAAAPLRDREAAERCNARGLECVQRQAYGEAEAAFRSALDADPFFGPAYCNLGLAQLELNQPFEAAWSLRHASQLMPKASQPRANLGLLFERVGRYESAEAELRAALALNPDDIEIIGQLARVHVRQNRFTDETRGWLQLIASQDDSAAWRDWARGQLMRFERNNLIQESRSSGGS